MRKKYLHISFCIIILFLTSAYSETSLAFDPYLVFYEDLKPEKQLSWKFTEYEWAFQVDDQFDIGFEKKDVITLELIENLTEENYHFWNGFWEENYLLYDFFPFVEMFQLFKNDVGMDIANCDDLRSKLVGFEIFATYITFLCRNYEYLIPDVYFFLPLEYVNDYGNHNYFNLLEDEIQKYDVEVDYTGTDSGWDIIGTIKNIVQEDDDFFKYEIDIQQFSEWIGSTYTNNHTVDFNRITTYNVHTGYLKTVELVSIVEGYTFEPVNQTYELFEEAFSLKFELLNDGSSAPFGGIYPIMTICLLGAIVLRKRRNKKRD